MDIKKFVEMQKRYLDEFFESEDGLHLNCSHTYVDWNEVFENWVDENKVDDEG